MTSAPTPVKVVRHCFTCNSQTQGRLRNVNNVAMRNILFKKHFEVLDCDLEEISTSKFVMCESCLKTLDKVFSMKSVLKKNLKDSKSVQYRQKRMILHSISPAVKKFVQNRLTPIKPRKSVKQLFSVNTEPEKESNLETSTSNSDSPFPPEYDHLYSVPPNTTSHAEHTYVVKDTPKSQENLSVYFLHKKSVLSPLTITQGPKECLQQTVENMIQGKTTAEEMLAAIVGIPLVFEKLWQIILMKISAEMDQLCSKKQPSVLRSKVGDINPQTFFREILLEMHQRCPRALDFLMTMACPVHLAMPEDSRVIAGMYAMAMYARNNQLIGFQKCMAASCIRYNAGNGMLGLLHTFGLSIHEKTKLVMLDDLGKINGKEVIAALNKGKTLKITVDNIDGRIKANQIRYGSGNRDYHYTHWSVILDRFNPRDLTDLSTQPKVVPARGPDAKTFFLSKEENASLRKCYSWMVQRILVEDVPALSAFSSVVPTVLNHQYIKVVNRPTDVYPMFVIMKDPKSLPNCVQIMDTMLGTLQSFYTSAGRGEEFENNVTIPLGGDQLTRVTFDSARHLRAGTHTRSDRLEQFTPVIEELFHVQQDLLEKIFRTYYKTETAREAGSLANYRAVLHRTNVNGDVKANGYEAHKDFLITVTRALLIELTCELLRLEKPDDIQEMLPTDLQELTATNKRRWLENKVSPVIDKIVGTCSAPPAPATNVFVRHKGTLYHVTIPAENAGKTIQLKLNGDNIQINVPSQKENVQEEMEDDVQKYSTSIVRVAIDFIVFCEVIKAGDINMISILMKRFIPLFIGLSSYRSKYAIECVDFITKTECLLSEYDSVRVKLGLLVNRKGIPGKNKPADMQQENNIKLVKHVIRGLGAGKTDKAMMRVSKAAPVVSELVAGLESSGAKRKKKKSKSLKEDLLVLSTKLRALRPFKGNRSRQMESFNKLSANIIGGVEKGKLQEFVIRHSIRAMNKFDLNQDQND